MYSCIFCNNNLQLSQNPTVHLDLHQGTLVPHCLGTTALDTHTSIFSYTCNAIALYWISKWCKLEGPICHLSLEINLKKDSSSCKVICTFNCIFRFWKIIICNRKAWQFWNAEHNITNILNKVLHLAYSINIRKINITARIILSVKGSRLHWIHPPCTCTVLLSNNVTAVTTSTTSDGNSITWGGLECLCWYFLRLTVICPFPITYWGHGDARGCLSTSLWVSQGCLVEMAAKTAFHSIGVPVLPGPSTD